MNRAELAWALKAVLPHAQRRPQLIGVESRPDATYFYATDKYTMGIARVNDFAGWLWQMTAKEAAALMRFVRPERVPHREHEIIHMISDNELHIGWIDTEDERADADGMVSGVFELQEFDTAYALNPLLALLYRLEASPVEWDEIVMNPDLGARFAAAQRDDTERLRLIPRHHRDQNGAAIVFVGPNFMGAIAGMTYESDVPTSVAEFFARQIEIAA